MDDRTLGNQPQPPTQAETRTLALAYLAAGLSVVLIETDGKKKPWGKWKVLQKQLFSVERISSILSARHLGLAIIGGKVSGNLEQLDFDSRADDIFPKWSELVEKECPGLIARLPITRTPKDGFHVRYRCTETQIPGNTKLAEEPFTNDKGKPDKRALIETRGEAGYALAPGCPPECHPTKKLYVPYSGPAITQVPPIAAAEREVLIRCARAFDLAAQQPRHVSYGKATQAGKTPWEDYDRCGPEWAEILEPHGCTVASQSGPVTYWRRPGKEDAGCSATTGYCKGADGVDLLKVFSTSYHPFEGGKAYSKSQAHALLNHSGDFSASARDLRRQGYGEQTGGRTARARTSAPAAAAGPGGAQAEGGGTEADLPAQVSAHLDRLEEVLANDGPAGLYKDRHILDALVSLSIDDPPAYAVRLQQLRAGGLQMQEFKRAIRRMTVEEIRERPPALARGETGGFFESDGCICRTKITPDGPLTVSLANFTAKIVDETVKDDGAEQQTCLGIEGKLFSGRPLPRIEVPSEHFSSLSWVVAKWGSDAIVWPGEIRALPAAIQALSQENKARLKVFTHTGWRNVGAEWFFLHAGGAIGVRKPAPDPASQSCPGPSSPTVDLPHTLAGYSLPVPPGGEVLVEAVKSSLRLLELGPPRLLFPLLAAVYRSVLGPSDFSLFLAGPSGCCKTATAALAQQHFGAGLDARHLPGSWASTGNSLESVAFVLKDALFVVDDFAPQGSQADVQRYHREADRLLRAQGNSAGRGRMRADTTLRPARPPRGLILSTGEDVPKGHSLRARMLILPFGPDDVPPAKLTPFQAEADAGRYAEAMAGFLTWLAPQYETVRHGLPDQINVIRGAMQKAGQHARTPGIIADLFLGLQYFLRFAEAAGAIGEDDRLELERRGEEALLLAAEQQDEHVQEADPVRQFIGLTAAALASGRAHVANAEGDAPLSPGSFGWRHDGFSFKPLGRRIGWTTEGRVLLDPDAAYAEAQRLAVEKGESLPVASSTLWRRINQQGLLADTDCRGGKTRLKVRRTLEGRQREVISFLVGTLYPGEKSGQSGQTEQNRSENGHLSTATSVNGNGKVASKVANESGQNSERF